jgi:hypothetical protein
VAQDDGGAERADAVDVAHRRGRGHDGFNDAFVDSDELVVEPANIAEKLERDPLAFDLDRLARMDAPQDPPGTLGRPRRRG